MITVTCAVIKDNEGRILAAQRSQAMSLPLKWEFPGGKLEIGESAEDCLIREIKEELDINIKIIKPLKENIHRYAEFGIKLIPFECGFTGGEIKLLEHAQYLWLYPEELGKLDWADADRPILEEILA